MHRGHGNDAAVHVQRVEKDWPRSLDRYGITKIILRYAL